MSEEKAIYAIPPQVEFFTDKQEFEEAVSHTSSLFADIAELERANQDRAEWNAVWKQAATIWRRIAKFHLAKIGILYRHIEEQDAERRELREKVGSLKERVDRIKEELKNE